MEILHESYDICSDLPKLLKKCHRKAIWTQHLITSQIKYNSFHFLFLKTFSNQAALSSPMLANAKLSREGRLQSSLVYKLTKKSIVGFVMLSWSIKKLILLPLILADASRWKNLVFLFFNH